MTTGEGTQDPSGAEADADLPNASPELQDAIRSIDAIGENAWGPDDDRDEPREGEGGNDHSEGGENTRQ